MTTLQIFALIGGLGMFLYGMRAMGIGLEKAAGSKLKIIIEKLTKSVPRGILVGLLVTSLIQSSSATTVIVVGFVNAGVMTLMQAVGVIMGANIGTTVTAQILRLGDIQSNAWYLMMLKPAVLAPILLAIGVIMLMACKRNKYVAVGEILVGFGLLFIGMSAMEGAVAGIREMPAVRDAFVSLQNPLYGVMAGTIVTGIIQSSSASIGILQAVAATGLVTFSAAVPIIMGQNIGTCVTAMLSSLGTAKNAKRAALIHLYFNIIGTMVFMPLIYLVNYFVGIPFWDSAVNRGGIADFHTLFNIANTLMLFPFAAILVKLAQKSVRGEPEKKRQSFLDERLLASHAIALDEVEKEVALAMGYIGNSMRNFSSILFDEKSDKMAEVIRDQKQAMEISDDVAAYMGKIIALELPDDEIIRAQTMFYVLNGMERINKHIFNMIRTHEEMNEHGVPIDGETKKELAVIIKAVEEAFELTERSYVEKNPEMAAAVHSLYRAISDIKTAIASKHVARIAKKEYDPKVGLLYLNLADYISRVAEHSMNIADTVADERFLTDKELKKVYKAYLAKYAI